VTKPNCNVARSRANAWVVSYSSAPKADALDAVGRWRTTPGLNMIEYIDHGSLQMMDVPHKAALMIEIEGDADID